MSSEPTFAFASGTARSPAFCSSYSAPRADNGGCSEAPDIVARRNMGIFVHACTPAGASFVRRMERWRGSRYIGTCSAPSAPIAASTSAPPIGSELSLHPCARRPCEDEPRAESAARGVCAPAEEEDGECGEGMLAHAASCTAPRSRSTTSVVPATCRRVRPTPAPGSGRWCARAPSCAHG